MGEISEHGSKVKAGLLLTNLIRKIAEEFTEPVASDEAGDRTAITKAEALVREIWKRALGFREMQEIVNQNGVIVQQWVIEKPSLAHMNIILDRMEGKVGTAGNEGSAQGLAGKLDKAASSRINASLGV